MESIHYSEIIKLSHLEIKEALHVFLGAKAFSLHEAILFEDQRTFLGRDKIGCLFQPDFPSEDYKRVFKKHYDKLLDHINVLLETGVIVSCRDIRAIRTVSNQIPPLPLNEQILYLWKTEHLINWALGEGIALPKGLQAVLGIKQVEETSVMKKSNVLHLCLQALAQVVWFEYSPFEASHSKVIEDMRNIIENHSFQGKTLKKYVLCLNTPLDFIFSGERCKYFREDKQNVLRSLIKKIDPRPPELKKRGSGREKFPEPFPPKLIPGIFSSHEGAHSAINFKCLEIVLQTIGHYLFALRRVPDAESVLEHPLISRYIANRGSLVTHFAYHCIMMVCPERAYVDFCKSMPKDPFGFQKLKYTQISPKK